MTTFTETLYSHFVFFPPPPPLLLFSFFSSSPEDAYRIDVDVDGEVVGLDIIDTAGQVSENHTHTCFTILIITQHYTCHYCLPTALIIPVLTSFTFTCPGDIPGC